MPLPGPLRHVPEPWNYALAGGLASIPVTLFVHWQAASTEELSLNAVLLGGVVAGYLAGRAGVDTSEAGARAGLVGGLPVLLLVISELVAAVPALAGPDWFYVAGIAMAVVFVLFTLGIAMLVGVIGAAIGGWIGQYDTPRGPATGS